MSSVVVRAALALVAAALVAAPARGGGRRPRRLHAGPAVRPVDPDVQQRARPPLGGGADRHDGAPADGRPADLPARRRRRDAEQPARAGDREEDADTSLGRQVIYSVIGTPDNIANLDAGRNDAAFWRGVRRATISTDDGLAAVRAPARRSRGSRRPRTATSRPPARRSRASSTSWPARTDCAQRAPAEQPDAVPRSRPRNPDGRDANSRTTAWGFDPNRDFGTRNQPENAASCRRSTSTRACSSSTPTSRRAATSSRPTRTPSTTRSRSSRWTSSRTRSGRRCSRRSTTSRSPTSNYNAYDLFTPEYGDTVPALLMGAAGMTYEKGTGDDYGKQIYDHYLAIDTTINVTSDDKVNLAHGLGQAVGRGDRAGRELRAAAEQARQPAAHQITQQPHGTVCGYFFKPGQHSGDTARLMRDLHRAPGVHVYRLEQPVDGHHGVHEFGPTGSEDADAAGRDAVHPDGAGPEALDPGDPG